VYSWVSVNGLNGVAAVSAHSVWAVGSAATGKPLIEHWDGRDWRQVPSASPRGAQESLLNAVAATGSSTAWAVGYYNTGKTIKTLIERWNGRGWVQVTSPNPGGVHGSFLLGVAAAGSSSAWAVGYFSTGKTIKTLIERWNGRGWVQVTSPSPGGSYARSALNGVAAAGKSSAWAVGYYFGPPIRPLIERWNGRAWKVVTSPNPGGRDGGALNAVTTVGDSGAWAAGNVGTRTVDEALIERWNGRAWKQVTSPRPVGSRGSNLTAIAARSPANAWAVGYYFADTHVEPAVKTVIERWNGRAWKQEPSPNPGGSADHLPDQSLLQAVCTVSSSQAWAAGSYSSGNPHGKILIERRTGGTWSQVPAGR
jgi:erythromycin esterase-like protein